MPEYIDREAVHRAINKAPTGYWGSEGHLVYADDAHKQIDAIPAADVKPVVRGKWEEREVFAAKGNVDMLQSAFCPVCKRYHTTPYSYFFTVYAFCPNCGADMRGTTNE